MTKEELIGAIRELAGGSQTQMACCLGCTLTSVHAWVKGRRPVPVWAEKSIRAQLCVKRLVHSAGVPERVAETADAS